MALETARIQKPTRKLRKLLKKMPGIPSPREIHTFRTNLRRVETALQVFSLDSNRKGRRTAKTLSKLRKRAGKIRDMDVLTAHAASVELAHDENYCSVALLEYLGAQRLKHAAQPCGGFLIRPRTAELPLPRNRSSGWAHRPW
jgi:CHAD domain-containing protein